MAKFKVGDKVYVHWFGDDQDSATVVRYNPTNDTFDVRLDDGTLVHPKSSLLTAANSRACNTLHPYGSWKAASRGNVHVGDYVIHKAQFDRFKDDEEKLDRNSERVAGVKADGFWTKWSGTDELERFSDYYVFNAARPSVCNAVSTGLKDTNGNNLNVGDRVVHTSSRLHGKIVGKYNSYLINVKWEGGFIEECNPDEVKKTRLTVCGDSLGTSPLRLHSSNSSNASSIGTNLEKESL